MSLAIIPRQLRITHKNCAEQRASSQHAADTEYIGRNLPNLPTTDEVIELCRQNGFASNGLTYPPKKPLSHTSSTVVWSTWGCQ
jgi:hypothetical protein